MELLIDVQALAARLLVKERYIVIVDGTQLGNILFAKTCGTGGLIGKYFQCFARSVETLHIGRVKLSQEVAASRSSLGIPLLIQSLEGFAHGCTGHRKPISYFLVHQTVPGPKPTG